MRGGVLTEISWTVEYGGSMPAVIMTSYTVHWIFCLAKGPKLNMKRKGKQDRKEKKRQYTETGRGGDKQQKKRLYHYYHQDKREKTLNFSLKGKEGAFSFRLLYCEAISTLLCFGGDN
jgi:hypothetical protein